MIGGQKKFVLKILTAGEGGVGKTTLLHRYVSNRFMADTSMTIGVQFHLKNITFGGVDCTLQLWDFGGQDRFRFLLPTYASGAKGALLLFDLTRMDSTFGLESSWMPIVRKEDQNLPLVLLGTKLDRVDPNNPMFDRTFGEAFAREHNMNGYMETSSKTGERVEEAFRMLVKAIFDYNNIPYQENLV